MITTFPVYFLVQFRLVHFWGYTVLDCTDLALYRFKCTVLDYTDLGVKIGPGPVNIKQSGIHLSLSSLKSCRTGKGCPVCLESEHGPGSF